MTSLTYKIDLDPDLFEASAAATLAHGLVPLQRARDGDIVAIKLYYSDAYPGPFRDEGPEFVVKEQNGYRSCTYSQLEPASRPGMADAVLRLEEDEEIFGGHVRGYISEMRDEEDVEYHTILITTDAIGFTRPDVVWRYSSREWSQELFDLFFRLLCREADSAHEALSRHDELARMGSLCRWFLEGWDPRALPSHTPSGHALLTPQSAAV